MRVPEHNPGLPPVGGPSHRFPSATYRSFNAHLHSLTNPQEVTVKPAHLGLATWNQVHATLTALGLVAGSVPALRLRRLLNGDLTMLGILTEQYGTETINAIENGLPWRSEFASSNLSSSASHRFESFVRGALREEGRHPARTSGGPRERRDADPRNREAHAIDFLRREADVLLAALTAHVHADDLDAAERCQDLFHRAIDKLADK